MAKKRTIFICYNHKDGRWLERLQTALAPLTENHRLDLWDDQRIKPGADWRKEIKSALAISNAAVLLVTPAFFDSKFIMKKELPLILKRRGRDGLPVVWIPVSATNFKLTDLAKFRAAYDTTHPLNTLSAGRRDKAFVEIVDRIWEAATTTAVGDVLRTIDAITPATLGQEPGIVARQRDGRVEFEFRDGPVTDVIDPPDLGGLSDVARQAIITYQASMAAAYASWQPLYRRRDSLTPKKQKKLRNARRQMCDDLGKVLGFLESINQYPPDHYRIVRAECEEQQRSRR